ncbi:hypothetical protein, partial [Acidisphaera rubrifaciens]|uniref:hypothetical protein n=1 Tax=Acidisphaera rubrifaciens TaxID=50715 RepID=UPI0006626E9D
KQAVKAIVPLEPNSLGAEVLVSVTTFLTETSGRVVEAVGTVRSLPSFGRWLHRLVTDPHYQSRLLRTGVRLAAVLVMALLAEWLLMRLLRRPVAVVLARAGDRAVQEPDVLPPDLPSPDDL